MLHPNPLTVCLSAALAAALILPLPASADQARLNHLRERCEAAEPGGCHDYGVAFMRGRDVKKDHQKAAEIWQKGCDRDEADSCGLLASSYQRGRGVSRDLQKAVALLQKACTLGNGRACVTLGNAYGTGTLRLNSDPMQSAWYYSLGCKANDASACSRVAEMYAGGTGLRQDLEQAAFFYQKACELGSHEVCDATEIRTGGGTTQQDARRLSNPQELEKGCGGGSSSDCRTAGYIFHEGRYGIEADQIRAAALWTRGCELGDGESCAMTGYMYHSADGIMHNPDKARTFIEKACALDDPTGCYMLGVGHQRHMAGLSRDLGKAFSLFSKSCTLGSGQGCLSEARCYQTGSGVDQDQKKALGLYQKACSLGVNEACNEARLLSR